jgi:CO/xanthine dehydrogenase FAD-binding subunit
VKPPPFEYDAPASLDEALALLSEHGDDAKVLAGGQSLIPVLNFRLARPARLIDINNVAELERVDGGSIGALTRTRSLELRPPAPLLAQAVRHAGHVQIRNRSTVGGSCAHADPAAELPTALLALAASFRVRSAGGERMVAAADFFLGAFATALRSDELLVEVVVPAQRGPSSFVEHARIHGDFALAGAAVVLGDATAVALMAVADRPVRAPEAERLLAEGAPAAEAAAAAVRDLDPPSDLRATGRYRRALAEELVRRAIEKAASS